MKPCTRCGLDAVDLSYRPNLDREQRQAFRGDLVVFRTLACQWRVGLVEALDDDGLVTFALVSSKPHATELVHGTRYLVAADELPADLDLVGLVEAAPLFDCITDAAAYVKTASDW